MVAFLCTPSPQITCICYGLYKVLGSVLSNVLCQEKTLRKFWPVSKLTHTQKTDSDMVGEWGRGYAVDVMIKRISFGFRITWLQILALPPFVDLSRLFNHSQINYFTCKVSLFGDKLDNLCIHSLLTEVLFQ